jgi:hypothetical protein
VRLVRGRTKKLIVAFHFQLLSNQAGWRCEHCRTAGLEIKRRCGWLSQAGNTAARVVWARKHVSINTCPKSFVTAQSLAWLEEFAVRRRLWQRWPEELGAREAEAFLILESEWEAEVQNG